jgi:hypothetical protein
MEGFFDILVGFLGIAFVAWAGSMWSLLRGLYRRVNELETAMAVLNERLKE